MRILIVDDEPIIRQSLAQLITQTDKRCEIVGTAQNGQEALQLLPQLQPDVIFTDIRMPGMSGLELAQHISQSAPEIQIVILSGYAEFEYARSAIDSGVVSYLLKPTKIQELKTVLRPFRLPAPSAKFLLRGVSCSWQTVGPLPGHLLPNSRFCYLRQ